jgi:hypothetical protein
VLIERIMGSLMESMNGSSGFLADGWEMHPFESARFIDKTIQAG